MATVSARSDSYERFRRFVIWFVMILGAFSTLLLGTIVLLAYVFDGNISVYVNKFGEAGLELVVFAVVVGTVPFGLFLLDDLFRDRGHR